MIDPQKRVKFMINKHVSGCQTWLHLIFSNPHNYSVFDETWEWLKCEHIIFKKKLQLSPSRLATWGTVSKYRIVICCNFLHGEYSQSHSFIYDIFRILWCTQTEILLAWVCWVACCSWFEDRFTLFPSYF